MVTKWTAGGGEEDGRLKMAYLLCLGPFIRIILWLKRHRFDFFIGGIAVSAMVA